MDFSLAYLGFGYSKTIYYERLTVLMDSNNIITFDKSHNCLT